MSLISVRVLKNGVVVHQHEGASGWHDPSRKHGTAVRFGVQVGLHDSLDQKALAKPSGWSDLTPAQKAQYAEALAGKTFWIYPPKKADKEKAAAVAAAEEALLDAGELDDPELSLAELFGQD